MLIAKKPNTCSCNLQFLLKHKNACDKGSAIFTTQKQQFELNDTAFVETTAICYL